METSQTSQTTITHKRIYTETRLNSTPQEPASKKQKKFEYLSKPLDSSLYFQNQTENYKPKNPLIIIKKNYQDPRVLNLISNINEKIKDKKIDYNFFTSIITFPYFTENIIKIILNLENKIIQFISTFPYFEIKQLSSMLHGTGIRIEEAIDDLMAHEPQLTKLVQKNIFKTAKLSSILNSSSTQIGKNIEDLIDQVTKLIKLLKEGTFSEYISNYLFLGSGISLRNNIKTFVTYAPKLIELVQSRNYSIEKVTNILYDQRKKLKRAIEDLIAKAPKVSAPKMIRILKDQKLLTIHNTCEQNSVKKVIEEAHFIHISRQAEVVRSTPQEDQIKIFCKVKNYNELKLLFHDNLGISI